MVCSFEGGGWPCRQDFFLGEDSATTYKEIDNYLKSMRRPSPCLRF